MKETKYLLKNLDCANCAAKIEQNINRQKAGSAVVNFPKQLLILTAPEGEWEETATLAKNIIQKLEPDVEMIPLADEKSHGKGAEEDHAHEHENENTKAKLIKLAIGGVFFVIAFFLQNSFYQFALFLFAYLVIGGDVLLRAGKNILRGQVFDENFLMALATIGAFAIGEYPEGVFVMLFYQVGELFQDLAVGRSRKSISALMDIRPDYANVQTAEGVKKVAPESVNIRDVIVIKPGEKVPLDGEILTGNSTIDTAALTGESLPREVESGSQILSGTINQSGLLTVRVTKVYGQSTVAKILELVENAGNKKAEAENFITKFARIYTPIVVIIALLLAIIPPLFVPGALWSEWIYKALVVLLISCPCALVISIPLGFFGGIGGASKQGILIKGSNYLEALSKLDTVVFDKTGTLTEGKFSVAEIKPIGRTKEEILSLAALAECRSNHPIAKSIVAASSVSPDESRISAYEEIAGKGIRLTTAEGEILAGNAKLMDAFHISYSAALSIGTEVHLAQNGTYLGSILIADTVKSDAKKAISSLRHLGVSKTVMLTGDAKAIGMQVAEELGLDEAYCELLPDGKVEKMEELLAQKQKGNLAFVGDGINDAPVLARADIGIAMGGVGSDAAIEAADIVIMTDEPSKIADAVHHSRKTMRIIRQNVVFAIGIKVCVMIAGFFGAPMWMAIFADVGVSLLAILNSMRALKKS